MGSAVICLLWTLTPLDTCYSWIIWVLYIVFWIMYGFFQWKQAQSPWMICKLGNKLGTSIKFTEWNLLVRASITGHSAIVCYCQLAECLWPTQWMQVHNNLLFTWPLGRPILEVTQPDYGVPVHSKSMSFFVQGLLSRSCLLLVSLAKYNSDCTEETWEDLVIQPYHVHGWNINPSEVWQLVSTGNPCWIPN